MAINYDYKNKNVVVTGAAQGIGKVVAKSFAKAGANVAIVDLNAEKAEEVAKEIAQEFSVKTISIACDVSNPDEVIAMAEKAEKEFKTVDVLFNNAGINLHGPALEMTYETWSKVLSVNLTGIFLVAKEIAKIMVKQGHGSIVNTGSMSASIINRPQAQCAYNASKAGVVHLTKSLAMEWIEHRIRVNSISPGYTATEMSINVPEEWSKVWMETTPMARMAKPEEIANAVLYLADESSAYTTGADLLVDGGFTAW